jgi:hypothetical protein
MSVGVEDEASCPRCFIALMREMTAQFIPSRAIIIVLGSVELKLCVQGSNESSTCWPAVLGRWKDWVKAELQVGATSDLAPPLSSEW